jgi:hypothetical protein
LTTDAGCEFLGSPVGLKGTSGESLAGVPALKGLGYSQPPYRDRKTLHIALLTIDARPAGDCLIEVIFSIFFASCEIEIASSLIEYSPKIGKRFS